MCRGLCPALPLTLEVVQLAAAAAAAAAACAAAFSALGTPSRRAADAPYVLWVVSHNTALLAACRAADAALPGPLPALLVALSGKHGMLLCFLLANLLTGAVNLSVDTLAVGDAAAVALLVAYMALVCGSSTVLLKYWITSHFLKPLPQVHDG
jgi:phosphatidylinositol glycan class W